MIDVQFMLDKLPAFLGGGDGQPVFSVTDGLVLTLELLGISLFFGLCLAVPLGLMRVSRNRFVSGAVWLYTYVFRGTPLLVQLFIIYYGLSQFEAVRESWAWAYLREAYVCAIIAFTLNTAAYTTEIIAGQIRNTHWGEIEAAKAMGMSKGLMMRRIVVPSALRRALPAYSNEVVMMMQSTSVAGLVTLADLTGVARRVFSDSYLPFEPFLTAAAFYLALTFLFVWLFKLAERRWLAYLAPRKH
ncbi:amino acid ABC transporter membrane protein 2, PAAT family (TC 3.A.1.3.-) [Gulbenkiania indica]|uniref:Amino acid ABC transporter membrane protein 2, PAAT family (TC 3.A.1.3.-) n=2 Tax=Gulbenkiania TaxID=397456 RepID=A0A0K6H3Y4_9NEIS|nr:ABC transporter permease [Gulbenkiania indica]TCW30286.1 arginine/ornithine transport system permease protein [Gulbenkiania mobilis]CUA85551.1 amino acid ABC transporter membrane protein 2, PAAT family (TC 3.A.1.3.-) [Gulbenkiania indica]